MNILDSGVISETIEQFSRLIIKVPSEKKELSEEKEKHPSSLPTLPPSPVARIVPCVTLYSKWKCISCGKAIKRLVH